MSLCLHCDQEISTAFYNDSSAQDGPFCCRGCLTVYNVINQKGLSEYYEIKKNTLLFKKRAPVDLNSNQYSFLDDEDFQKEYSYSSLDNQPVMEFYLEGIHCLACLWIIEKMPFFVKGIYSSKLDMGRSVATVILNKNGKFSDVARELNSIGYKPHPLKINQTTNDFKIKETRSTMLRIGIAGAAAGNIMLYAVSLYAGAQQQFEVVFNALTVLFALPVLTYCAYPFYKTSYQAIKSKNLSIDVPISLALIMGGIMGIYNLVNGIHENYFDSLTALVFLLLISRYFLKIIQEKGLSTSDLHYFYQSESIQRINDDGSLEEIHPKLIKVNDRLKLLPNQVIPADGVVIKGESYLNNSLLTGESQLQKIKVDDIVYSGTMNVSSDLEINVTHVSRDSRLGKILKNVEDGWGQKTKIVDITNLISKYFVAAVFILAVCLFVIGLESGNTKLAMEKALTLLIVTCPCALAIATPLTFIRTLTKCTQKGIIIKDDSVIEKLSSAKNLFIDKTGTITQNQLMLDNIQQLKIPLLPIHNIIYALEKHSRHPVGLCLKNYFLPYITEDYDVLEFIETPGVGVSGIINAHKYEIKNYGLYEDEHLIWTFSINDRLRSDAAASIDGLRSSGLVIKILSGDKKSYVEKFAHQLGLSENEYAYELSPEDKKRVIKASSHTVMVGDGANDSMALSSADTGIAVFGAMDISLRAADVYLNLPGLTPVKELILISKETMKVIYRNLILSLMYNSISVVLAFTGHISPLTAAIIMPLSSLTVLVSTLIGTQKLRQLWKS